MVCMCMHLAPNVFTQGEWCVSVWVRMYRGMKVNTCACTENAPVCMHESMCVHGGGSNCTFGLAPGAP